MRGRGLYLDDLGQLRVLVVFHCLSGLAALVVIGPYAALKGREGVCSSVCGGKSR